MNDVAKPTVLMVDDDESILKSLKRLFRKEGYDLFTASNGQDALDFLRNHQGEVSVIISDQKMPLMTGAAFLEQAKGIFPDAVRILLTGYSEMDAIVHAVNKGEIHRYLSKPWNDDELVFQVRKAVEQYDLVRENKRLMKTIKKQNKQLYEFGKSMEKKIEERSHEIIEKSKRLEFLNKELEIGMFNTIRAFAALIEMVNPFLKGHGKRVSSLAVDIAHKCGLKEEEITQLEIAALLHDIGTIGFSSELLEKHSRNRCSKEDQENYRKHPVEGQNILSFIGRLDGVGIIIRNHHERFDGKGYPDGLFEKEIPMGSRIIAVADIYDRITQLPEKQKAVFVDQFLSEKNLTGDYLTEKDLSQQAALFHLKKNAFSKYDPDIVKTLIEVLKDKGVNLARERKVPFCELEPGMWITRSIYSSKGRFILPHKTILDEHTLEKLHTILQNREIPDVFFVMSK